MSKLTDYKPVVDPKKKPEATKDMPDADLDKVSGGHGQPAVVGGPGTYPEKDKEADVA
jgi:hypothetical protein